MKKIMNCALSAMLCLGMSMPVMAETTSEVPGSKDIPVTGEYQESAAPATVYSVDITWEGMDFIYQEASKGTWNPETHKYDNVGKDTWQGTGTVTFTNHSNAPITAVPSYKAAEGFEDASVTYDKASVLLGSADAELDENGTGKAVTGTLEVTPQGSLPKTATDNVCIGTLTLSLR